MAKTKSEETPEVDLTRCAGCGKEWQKNSHGYDNVEAYVGVTRVRVCSGGRSMYRGAKKACLMAAREKAQQCPGCGKGFTELGRICEECEKLLELARGNPDVSERRLFGFNTDKFFGRWNWHQAENDDVRDLGEELEMEGRELARLLAQGCTTGEYRKEHPPQLAVPLPDERERQLGTGKADWEDPSAELLPRQAEALTAFANRLRPYFERVYEYGKQTGHSFLVRLAQGDMGRKEFEELDEKVEKAKRGEPEEDE